MGAIRLRRRGSVWASAVVLGLLLSSTTIVATTADKPEAPDGKSEAADGMEQSGQVALTWIDQNLLRHLRTGRELLEKGRYHEAIGHFEAILEAPDDYFLQADPKTPLSYGLKAEADRLVGQTPEGREAYEVLYGIRARKLLDKAIAAGNHCELEKVSLQFFHTQAGREATLLLGLGELDRGCPQAAAMLLRRLRGIGPQADLFEPTLSLSLAAAWLRAERTAEARNTLVELKRRNLGRTVRIASREVALFGDEDPVSWLAAALGPRRTPGPARATVPGADDWPMFRGDPARNAAVLGGGPLLTARWRLPTADDPRIEQYLSHRAQTLSAEGHCTAPALQPLAVGDVLLTHTVGNLLAVDFNTGKRLWQTMADERVQALLGTPAGEAAIRQTREEGAAIELRVWDDATYGMLSSDGRCVFSIEGAGLGPALPKLEKQPGRSKGKPEPELPPFQPYNRLAARDIHTGKAKWILGGPAGPGAQRQAETFFLGAPLPLEGRLYVLAESGNEIRLLGLDAETGDVVCSQRLAAAEQDVKVELSRRLFGTSPAYYDGVLVCPTLDGSVVAVDLSTRWLRWRFSCLYTEEGMMRTNLVLERLAATSGIVSGSRWLDSMPVIADRHVLFRSLELDYLVCLQLADGKLKWKQPRDEDDLYLACVADGKAMLVGRQKVRAVRMADGKAAWEKPVALPDGAVPSGRGLLSGHCYHVPLSSGGVAAIDISQGRVAAVAKSRDGDVPGNLLAHRGHVVSQTATGLASFLQVEPLHGELQRRLAADPQDAAALTLRGEMLLDEGRISEALNDLRLACKSDGSRRARRLLRDALLEGLRRDFADYKANAAEIETLIDNPQQRATFLARMAAGLQASGQWLAALDQYRKLIDLGDGLGLFEAGDATLSVRPARWIEGQLEEFRAKADRRGIEALNRFLAERKKSQDQLPEAELLLGSDPGAGDRLPAADAWPSGAIEVEKNVVDRSQALASAGVKPIEAVDRPVKVRVSGRPALHNLSIDADPAKGIIDGRDGLGNVQWRLPMVRPREGHSIFEFLDGMNGAVARGHLLVMMAGNWLVALDTRTPKNDGSARILWSRDLTDPSLAGRSAATPGRQLFVFDPNQSGPPVQNVAIGPVTAECVCYRRLHDCVAVHPVTGETLWVRHNIPAYDYFWGDEHYLFISPANVQPEQAEALMLSPRDGRWLGKRKLPLLFEIVNGRELLVLLGGEDFDKPESTLEIFDVWSQRAVWGPMKFSRGARFGRVENDAIVVYEPDGRLMLLSLADGRRLMDMKIERPKAFEGLEMLHMGRQYFLVVSEEVDDSHKIPTTAMPGWEGRIVARGKLYSFDERGKSLWPAPVTLENQCLITGQPPELPVLVLACTVHPMERGRDPTHFASVLCIDKRSGRVVLQERFAYRNPLADSSSSFQISGSPERREMRIRLDVAEIRKEVEPTLQATIRLKFTDKDPRIR